MHIMLLATWHLRPFTFPCIKCDSVATALPCALLDSHFLPLGIRDKPLSQMDPASPSQVIPVSVWGFQGTEPSGMHGFGSCLMCLCLRWSNPRLSSPQWFPLPSQWSLGPIPMGFFSCLISFTSVCLMVSFASLCLLWEVKDSRWESPSIDLKLTRLGL